MTASSMTVGTAYLAVAVLTLAAGAASQSLVPISLLHLYNERQLLIATAGTVAFIALTGNSLAQPRTLTSQLVAHP